MSTASWSAFALDSIQMAKHSIASPQHRHEPGASHLYSATRGSLFVNINTFLRWAHTKELYILSWQALFTLFCTLFEILVAPLPLSEPTLSLCVWNVIYSWQGGFESADATEISNTKKGPIKPATPAQASEAAPAPDNQSKKRKAPVSEAAAAPVSEPAPVKKLKADAPPAPAAVKKSDEKKLTDKKTVEKKSMETKPAEKKSMETKPAEKKLSGAQNSSRPGTASAKVPVKAAPAQPVKAAPVPPATGGASAKTGGGLVSKKRGGHGGNA